MHALIKSHRTEIRALAERHGLRDVRIFGSMARGDADDASDVDLLVTLPPGRTGLALGALLMDVQALLGRRVHVVTDHSLHPGLRDRVLEEARML
ncbi:MAG: nucleotidyltransferase family protein [Holophagales bacterium]|nr:nucleotidyltransferase family protein [Holophagales bacterium]MYD23733.1 nucleotidyltransferase family protein [Holophagales bacterium]MYI33416.1 nucleotidyltransferase family protein [Holophagales bacterium]